MTTVPIVYFSDVLCIWAYIAQLRIDAVCATFGEQVRFAPRYCSVFGDTAHKMATTWKDKGGYDGFNAHLMESAAKFPEIHVSPDIWRKTRPASSTSPHLTLKAVGLEEAAGAVPSGSAERAAWAMRQSFFEQARDIGRQGVQLDVIRELGLPTTGVEARIQDGAAFAALASDYFDAAALDVRGSPTFVLNDGRQKLYGNVGYRIIEANVLELLRAPGEDEASWC